MTADRITTEDMERAYGAIDLDALAAETDEEMSEDELQQMFSRLLRWLDYHETEMARIVAEADEETERLHALIEPQLRYVQEQMQDRLTGPGRQVERIRGIIDRWARWERESAGRPKKWATPAGTVRTTTNPQRVIVTDEQAVLEHLAMMKADVLNALIRVWGAEAMQAINVNVSLAKSRLSEWTSVKDGRVVDKAGNPVPGLGVQPEAVTTIIATPRD